MRLANDGLFKYLDRDTIRIVTDYARYSELEKTWIALHYHKYNYGLTWKVFYTDRPMEVEFVVINTNPVNRTCAIKHRDINWKLGDQLIFHIEFGSSIVMTSIYQINVTTEDLVPSSRFQLNTDYDLARLAIENIRPKYLAAMQKTIDKI